MIELGQLERRHEDFARRNTQVVVSSLEGVDDARKTKEQFPHLLVLADEKRGLAEATQLIHPHVGPNGSDANMPTTILVDGHGTVSWLYRSGEIIARLSPDDVLQAIDQHIPTTQ
jgi:peroxiredoxin